MFRLVAAILLGLMPAVGWADGSPGNTDIPGWLSVVGTRNGVPQPGAEAVMTIRDFTNNPVVGALVTVSFANCPDVRLCEAVIPGVGAVSCANNWISGTTDTWGQVRFTIVGGGINSGNTPGATGPCAEVRQNGEFLGTCSVKILDTNGALPDGNGLSGTDLSLSQADFLNAIYLARSDFDESWTLTGTDLSLHLRHFLKLGSVSGCHDGTGPQPYCP